MKTKRVLVTGASGFVGRPLVAALVRAGYTVRAATRRPVSFPDSVESVVVPDFIYPIDWTPFLQGVDIVVHLAGLAHSRIPDTDYSEFDQINRIATQRLASAAKTMGVERFVYISSVRAQTGASATRTVRESDEPSPTNQYGRAKLAAERAIQAVGVPFTIFRPVVIYGPRPKGNMRIVVRLARSPLPLPVFNNRRSLLAVDNLISAIVFALNNPDTIGETYLVADSKPMTMSEIFTILRMVQGRRLTSVPIPHVLIRLALMVIGRTDLWSRLSGELINTRFASRARGAPRQVGRPSCRAADRMFLAALARTLPRNGWGSVSAPTASGSSVHQCGRPARTRSLNGGSAPYVASAEVMAYIADLQREVRCGDGTPLGELGVP